MDRIAFHKGWRFAALCGVIGVYACAPAPATKPESTPPKAKPATPAKGPVTMLGILMNPGLLALPGGEATWLVRIDGPTQHVPNLELEPPAGMEAFVKENRSLGNISPWVFETMQPVAVKVSKPGRYELRARLAAMDEDGKPYSNSISLFVIVREDGRVLHGDSDFINLELADLDEQLKAGTITEKQHAGARGALLSKPGNEEIRIQVPQKKP